MGHYVPLILKCWVKCMKNVANGAKDPPSSFTVVCLPIIVTLVNKITIIVKLVNKVCLPVIIKLVKIIQ